MVIFVDADLAKADLTGSNLRQAGLTGAHLNRAVLTGADLTGADLVRADLTDTNLMEAILTKANLSGAILAMANLTGAILSGVYLHQTWLYETILGNVNLSSAKNLASCRHYGPSIIDHRTLIKSGQSPGSIPPWLRS